MKPFRALTTGVRPQLKRVQCHRQHPFVQLYRPFHAYGGLQKIEKHVLSDIGEGVKEVQIIQWFVEEGAAVEEWAPLCEVQSDKASVEITSKYSGVVKKLHFDTDAIVQVGDAMLDIEVEGADDAEVQDESTQDAETETEPELNSEEQPSKDMVNGAKDVNVSSSTAEDIKKPDKHEILATPAVRALLKEHKIEISDVQGTGKDGRVSKEDVYKHVEAGTSSASAAAFTPTQTPVTESKQSETIQNLTPIQSAMFKSMTKSLNIPHFLYSDSINISNLVAMRSSLNHTRDAKETPKFSYMPFVIKAVSLALNKYPILNARLDVTDPTKPKLVMRSNHNIGVAMDTPAGLLVPVIKNVSALSITSISKEIYRLAELGQAGKLSNSDLSGGTITVSNIGNIGGGVVAPVIVDGQLAIMGMGKIKATPVFASDGKTVERADMLSTSWSADHRVIDGATMARMATVVQNYLEHPERMMVEMN